MRSTLRQLWNLLQDDLIATRSAATSYYIVLALVPFLVLLFVLGTVTIGAETSVGLLYSSAENIFGPKLADFLSSLVERTLSLEAGMTTSTISALILLYALSVMIAQVRATFADIYSTPQPRRTWLLLLVQYLAQLLAFLILLAFAVLILAIFTLLRSWIAQSALSVVPFALTVLGNLLSVGLFGLLFFVVYYLASKRTITMKGSMRGALVAAAGFTVLNTLFAVVLSGSLTIALYGVGSSLIAFMFWLYYSIVILYVGAELSKLREPMRDN